jgi:hypothetical protein
MRMTGQRRVAETLVAGAVAQGNLTLLAGQLLLHDGAIGAPSIAFSGDTDSGIYYSTGVRTTFGGADRIAAQASQVFIGGTLFMSTNSISFAERTDPTAPAVNGALLYAKDNGAAKTQLAVRFNTGAVQTPATEP